VAKATDKLTLRGGWHQAARYPSFTELYQDSWFLAAETSSTTIPLASFMANPDLQPEHIESYESGIEYQASPRLLTKVDLYQNVIDDSIIITYPVFQFANHPGDARIRGLEAELRYQPKSNLTTFINWSYQRSKAQGSALDAMGNPLEMTYAPRHKVNAGFSYEPTQQWLINLESSCRDEYYAPTFWYGIAFPDAPARRALDGYCLVDIGVKYKPLFASTALTLGLQAKNLANERPYETLSGFAGRRAGREFFLTLEYNWNP
jgi:outer membrane receptor protein involved in Fe transport